jgi:hypothetical protein
LLRRCLVKDPKRRLRDIGDIGLLLEDAPVPAGKGRGLWKVAAGLLVLLLVLAIALSKPWRATTGPIEQPLVRLDLDLGPDASLGSSTGPAVILSPDGSRLVFVSQGQDGTRRLFTRRLDQPKATPLARTEVRTPLSSPRTGSGSDSSRKESCRKFGSMAGSRCLCATRLQAGALVGARMATSSRRSTPSKACHRFHPGEETRFPLRSWAWGRTPIGGPMSCPVAGRCCSP